LPRGLPRSYIERARRELPRGASISRIFKRAWKLYKGSKVYSALSGRRKTSRKTRKRGLRSLARRKRRYSRKMTVPIAPLAGILAGVTGPSAYGSSILERLLQGNFVDAGRIAAMQYLGYNVHNGSWDITKARGLLPLVLGILVHKFVGGSPLNFNRMLARHKIPVIRI